MCGKPTAPIGEYTYLVKNTHAVPANWDNSDIRF